MVGNIISKGTSWTSRTSAADNNWGSVTYGNGLFVAVAYSGTGNRVMTSPDGINWTARTSATDNPWYSVTYGNGLFVAVTGDGTGNRVMTSPDGINWTIRTSAADNDWRSVTYGNGLFVAVAGSGTGNRVMTSPDGINWTIRTSAADNGWYSVIYGNGLFVAVAYSGTGNRVMTSPDGINWTIRTSAADNQWLSVTYGNGLFVAVSYTGTGNRVMTSPDGITWTSRTSAADNDWRSVTYGNGLFVAVASSGTGNRVMTSGKQDYIAFSPNNIYQGGLSLAGGVFSAPLGSASAPSYTFTGDTNTGIYSSAADTVNITTGGTSRLTISTTAFTGALPWQGQAGTAAAPAISFSGDTNTGMYGPGSDVLRLATAGADRLTITATGNIGIGSTAPGEKLEVVGNIISKGTLWTIRTSAADNGWYSVTYGNGLFVAVAASGTGNRVMTSPDGINWTIRTSAADNGWYSVTYGNGLFVAVSGGPGTGNRVMTSPDGITWTSRTSAADNAWLSVTYGNGLFVAVANSGTGNRVMTSPDGINWTIRTSAADNSWFSVTYGNGLFVAVAYSGTGNRVMTSPDGINWTIRTSAADNGWYSVIYGNGLFVAVANSGTGNRVTTSPDGINWTIRTSAADNSWFSVTYGNGLFVAVANSGTGNRAMTSGKQDYIAFSPNNIYQGGMSIMGGNVGIGTTEPTGRLDIVGSQNFTAFSAPGTLAAGTPTAGGSCDPGTHSYKVTFTSAGGGETTGGATSTQITCVLTTGQTAPLSAIPTGPAGTISRKIYRTAAGDTGSYLLLTTIADNTTTTYSDTTADGSLGTAAPASNTTAVANLQTGGTTRMVIDNSGNVGIGTASPGRKFDVLDNSDPQMRLTYDVDNRAEFQVSGTGVLTITTAGSGADIIVYNDNLKVCANDGCPAITMTGTGNIQVEGDIYAAGGYKNSFNFAQSDAAASQTAVVINVLGLVGNTEYVLPYAGSIIGISVASNTARTAGTLTVDATVNGTASGLQAVLDATNTTYHSAAQGVNTDVFSAGNRLGVKITTDAGWLPTTADIVVTVIIEY